MYRHNLMEHLGAVSTFAVRPNRPKWPACYASMTKVWSARKCPVRHPHHSVPVQVHRKTQSLEVARVLRLHDQGEARRSCPPCQSSHTLAQSSP